LTPLDSLWMRCMIESSQLQSASPVKCMAVSGKKLNTILMYVVPLMGPILRSTEHIRNFVRSSVWRCTDFSRTLYGWDMFYLVSFKAKHSVYYNCCSPQLSVVCI
jgi:hypothetical protein